MSGAARTAPSQRSSGSEGGEADPSPLSRAQTWALGAAVARELTWTLASTAREMRGWRALAERIPDGPLREDAMHALDHKRGYADGAALFTILPRRRHRGLLSTLLAYETAVDYLDNVSERHPTYANGQQLHLALIDALDPTRPMADYYRHSPWRDDGGYLNALVETCRAGCDTLPSYALLRPYLAREAYRSRVLGLNHELDPALRDAGLRAWAQEEYPDERELAWYELSGAASATLFTHALLALAADPTTDEAAIAAVSAAHWPWIALATTLLDSWVDVVEDAANGGHCYFDHYPSHELALVRTHESVARAMQAATLAPRRHRHTIIAACMVSLYLSADYAASREERATTGSLTAAGGSLVRLLVPILRTWRRFYGQRF
ncbi:MAG TPA: DUF2600 family protein [Conexibacter sp.]|jgi:tetraprenyl-beta-curcumene synthase